MAKGLKFVYLVMDGQWGSTGKGLIAGKLAVERNPDGVVCNFGPNAGHTYVTRGGEVVMTQQLPTGIVTPGAAVIFIGPGAIIDPDLMQSEITKFAHHLENKKLVIHPRAAIVLPFHKEQEKDKTHGLGRISSTQKGTGAAAAYKIMREWDATVGYHKDRLSWGQYIVSEQEYNDLLTRCSVLQVESAQGFELGLNQGFDYPHCTGRDVTPAQIMNDCGVPHWVRPEVIVSLRTFPIRVGHQYDERHGEQIQVGHSGPVYFDQQELTWGEGPLVDITPELTTVTQKVRRIFTFSMDGFKRMAEFVHPDAIFLNFANYLGSTPSGISAETMELVDKIDAAYTDIMGYDCGSRVVTWVGCGPSHNDVIDRHQK